MMDDLGYFIAMQGGGDTLTLQKATPSWQFAMYCSLILHKSFVIVPHSRFGYFLLSFTVVTYFSFFLEKTIVEEDLK